MPGRRRAPKAVTAVRKSQIALAALRLLGEKNNPDFSMEEVGKKVGLTTSGLYRHFKGKSDILDAILDLIQERMSASARQAEQDNADPVKALKELRDRHVEMIRNNGMPCLVFSPQLLSGTTGQKARLFTILKAYQAQIASLVERGQKAEVIRQNVSSTALAKQFIGMLMPAAFLWFLSGGKYDVQKHVDETWSIFAQMIQDEEVGKGNLRTETSERR